MTTIVSGHPKILHVHVGHGCATLSVFPPGGVAVDSFLI